jgi:hypothetical protein
MVDVHVVDVEEERLTAGADDVTDPFEGAEGHGRARTTPVNVLLEALVEAAARAEVRVGDESAVRVSRLLEHLGEEDEILGIEGRVLDEVPPAPVREAVVRRVARQHQRHHRRHGLGGAGDVVVEHPALLGQRVDGVRGAPLVAIEVQSILAQGVHEDEYDVRLPLGREIGSTGCEASAAGESEADRVTSGHSGLERRCRMRRVRSRLRAAAISCPLGRA